MGYFQNLSTIIDAISSVATVAAVIVAFLANRKSNEQLQKTIEMHEQSKNISLFEKRVTLFDAMLNREAVPTLSVIEIEILFNDEIATLLTKKLKLIKEEKRTEYDVREYISILSESGMIEGNTQSIKQLFVEQELKAEEYEDYKEQYLQFCQKYQLSKGGRVYNFNLLSEEIGRINVEIEKIDENIKTAGKEFIKQSIQKLNNTRPTR